MLILSNSKVNTWRKCHYSYYLKYKEKLVKKSKAGALFRGSMLHECLEAYNNGKSWKKVYKKYLEQFNKDYFAEEIEEMGNVPKMVYDLMESYVEYYKDEEDELEYLVNELHFELPLIKDVSIQGYIDAVVRRKSDNSIWAMETKTYAREPDPDFLIFNNQSALYNWALQQLYPDEKIGGTLWNIIKAKQPSEPTILKSGEVSKRGLDSTPLMVRNWLLGNNFNPEDYQELLEKVSYNDFFSRYYIRTSDKVINSIMQDFKDSGEQILSNQKLNFFIKDKNLNRDCTWCNYKEICHAELEDNDVDFIRTKMYKIREEEENGSKKEKKKK